MSKRTDGWTLYLTGGPWVGFYWHHKPGSVAVGLGWWQVAWVNLDLEVAVKQMGQQMAEAVMFSRLAWRSLAKANRRIAYLEGVIATTPTARPAARRGQTGAGFGQ